MSDFLSEIKKKIISEVSQW